MKQILLLLLVLLVGCGPRHLARNAFRHGIKQQQKDLKLLDEISERHPEWVKRTDTITVRIHDTIRIEKRVIEYKPQSFRDKSRENFLLDSLLGALQTKLTSNEAEGLKESIRKVFINVPAYKDFEVDTLGILVKLKNGRLTVDVREQKIGYVKEEKKTGVRIEAIRERRWWEDTYRLMFWLLLALVLFFIWWVFRSEVKREVTK